MAVAFDAKPTAYNSADGLNQQVSGATSISAASGMTIGGSANLLVGQLCYAGSGAGIPTGLSMTWDSVSMTSRIEQSRVGGSNFAFAAEFTLDSPATGAKTLAAAWTVSQDVYMSCASFSGASFGSATSNTQLTSIAVSTTSDGATVAVFAVNGSAPTVDQTKIWAEAPLNPGGGGSYAIGGSGTNTHNFTGAGGTDQAIAAISLVTSALPEVNATPGSWSWAGNQSAFQRGPETAFQQNAFQSNAFQIFGGTVAAGGATTINAGVGAWNWAGSQATTTQLINAGVGAWNWAGTQASTTQLINAVVGAWTWAGTQATTTQLINAGVGAWNWAGVSVSFAGATVVNAGVGAWNWAGTAATTTQLINASVGAWNWAGVQAATTQLINAGIGAFSWAGSQSSFTQLINAGVGAWSWAGTQSQIVQFTTIDSTPGLWNWAGSQASITTEETGGVTGAGSQFGGRKRERYIARFKGHDYYFSTLEDLEEFVKQALASEKPKPKKIRKPVRIRLTPVFEEEISQYVEIPARISQLPVSKALEQVRRLEARVSNDDEDDDWLILIA